MIDGLEPCYLTAACRAKQGTRLLARQRGAPVNVLVSCLLSEERYDCSGSNWTSQDLVDSAAPVGCRFELFRTHSA